MKGGWHGPKFSECYFAAGDRRNFAGRFSMGENKTQLSMNQFSQSILTKSSYQLTTSNQ
jgi:hypothetical protein